MKCITCGAETQSDEQFCSICIKLEHRVQVLTPEEKQDFSGITIEQDQGKQTNAHDDYLGNNKKQRIYVNFSMGQTGILTKIILGIIFVGLLFVVLPVALLVISIVVFFLYVMRK